MNRFLKRLEARLLEFLEANPSKDIPYHNNAHLKGVWGIARDLWNVECEDVGLEEPTWELAVLMVASLFHDYAHSGGHESDAINVKRSRDYVSKLLMENNFTFPHFVHAAIDSAIACTEFPFIREPANKLEMVLRDADLLYATLTQDPETILVCLRAEICISQNRAITFAEMYEGQVKFLGTTRMFTRTAQVLWDKYTQPYLDEMAKYARVKT